MRQPGTRGRSAALPLLQPFRDDCADIAVGQGEYVLPLHIQSELFQLGETQPLEPLRQGGGLVPQVFAEALLEPTEPLLRRELHT